MANFFTGLLRALKLPVKLLKERLRKRPKTSKLEQKKRTYVWNFSEGRLKNKIWKKPEPFEKKASWKKKSGKKLKKNRKLSRKKANNWTKRA